MDDEKHKAVLMFLKPECEALYVKPKGLLGDINTTIVFHHPVEAKI